MTYLELHSEWERKRIEKYKAYCKIINNSKALRACMNNSHSVHTMCPVSRNDRERYDMVAKVTGEGDPMIQTTAAS